MTFTINPENAVNYRQAAAPDPVRGGVEGGSRGVRLSAPADPGPPATTALESLVTFVGGERARAIQADAREKAFMSGMSRAAEGVAAKDIAEQRPAWARLFGDDAATAGARAYEKVTDAAALQAQVADSLPTLRMLDTETAMQEVRKLVKARRTGDPERDAVMEASVMQWLPQWSVSHAKAHLGYQQEVAVAQATQAFAAGVSALESANRALAQDPRLGAESLDAPRENLRQLLEPLPGANLATHSKMVREVMASALAQGNFAAWRVAKDEGLLATLDQDEVRRLEQSAYAAANKYLPEKVAPNLIDAWFAARLDPSAKPEELEALASRLNTKAAADTGITEVPFISPKELEQAKWYRMSDDQRRAEAAKAEAKRQRERAEDKAERAALAARARAEEEAGKFRMQAMLAARASAMLSDGLNGKVPPGAVAAFSESAATNPAERMAITNVVDTAVMTALRNGQPEQAAQLLSVAGNKAVGPEVSARLAGVFDSQEPPADIQLLATTIASLPPMAQALVPTRVLKAVQSFNTALAGTDPKDSGRVVAAWGAAKAQYTLDSRRGQYDVPKEAVAKAMETITDGSGWADRGGRQGVAALLESAASTVPMLPGEKDSDYADRLLGTIERSNLGYMTDNFWISTIRGQRLLMNQKVPEWNNPAVVSRAINQAVQDKATRLNRDWRDVAQVLEDRTHVIVRFNDGSATRLDPDYIAQFRN